MKRLKKVLMNTDRLRISMKTLDNGRQLVFNEYRLYSRYGKDKDTACAEKKD